MRSLHWRGRRLRPGGRAGGALARIGVPMPAMRTRDVLGEAWLSATRSPVRTLLSALGTILGVATVVSIVGLSATAGGAVSDTFDVLRATQVVFTERGEDAGGSPEAGNGPAVLTLSGEKALERLNGVTEAGLIWKANQGEQQPIRRVLSQPADGAQLPHLPVFGASAGALTATGTRAQMGRLYDAGMEVRHDRVGLLGRVAAEQLGITSVDRGPVVYLRDTPITIIGLIGDTNYGGGLLSALVVPTTTAEDLALLGERQMVVRTAPGAAQTIAAQGPFALAATRADRVAAAAPPDPTSLRNEVQGSLTSLLFALASIALTIGIVAIANTTLMAVMQRRAEIGLRRAIGAAPRHIAFMILTETAMTGTIGGLLGANLGVLVIAVVSASKGWAPVLDPAVTFAAPLVGTLAGILAGSYPALKATRITPIAALQR